MKSKLRHEVEEALMAGRISISQAAKLLGVSYADMWEHVQHMKPSEEDKPDRDDYVGRLKYIVELLEERVRQIALSPVSAINEKTLTMLTAELRKTIETLAKLQGMIQTAPQVNISVVVLNQLKELLLAEAPPELRVKVAELLEKLEGSEP